MCCFKIVERRGGPPCLLQKLLSWVRLAPDSVLGREKTSKAGKVLKISHPWQELGGEATLTEAAAVYLPHIQCQWKESYKPIQGQKVQLGVPSGSNFPIQFLPGVCKAPFDGGVFVCSVMRLPQAFLLDAEKSWFDAVQSEAPIYLPLAIFFYFCLLCT